jgi:hypothetical protein
MKRTALLVPAVFVLSTAMLVAGCGSDSKTSSKPHSSTSSTPTKSADPAAALVPLQADGFSISLPHKATSSPQTFDTPAGKVTTTVYSDVDDNSGFIAAETAYPNGAAVDLDGAVKGVATNFTGKIDVNDTVQIQGHDARKVRISGTAAGGPITIYLLVVNVDSKLFQLQYVLKGAAPATPPAVLDTVAATLRFS